MQYQRLHLGVFSKGIPDEHRNNDPAPNENMLARMVRLYYPHENVADQVYLQTADNILTAAASDSQLQQLLDDAYAALDGAGDQPFIEMDAQSQLAAMTKVQDEAFFTAIKFQVLARFYAHAEVWKAINYPGSSVEYGGYVERGFNDIDWPITLEELEPYYDKAEHKMGVTGTRI